MVMQILIRLWENDGENLAELVKRPTRLGRNLKTYLELGADAEIADLRQLQQDVKESKSVADSELQASKHVRNKPQPGESSSSYSSLCSVSSSSSLATVSASKPKLCPLSRDTFRRTLKYNRATKTGLKITYVRTKVCDDCRNLPITRNKIKRINEELAKNRAAGDNCTNLEDQLTKLEAKLIRLERHAQWIKVQRPFIENLQRELSWGNSPRSCVCVQDYGGFYNSLGKKVKSLALSIFDNAPNELACGDSFIRYVDHWFHGSSCGVTGEYNRAVWIFM